MSTSSIPSYILILGFEKRYVQTHLIKNKSFQTIIDINFIYSKCKMILKFWDDM